MVVALIAQLDFPGVVPTFWLNLGAVYGPLVQLEETLDLGSKCCGFESHGDYKSSEVKKASIICIKSEEILEWREHGRCNWCVPMWNLVEIQ